MGIAIYYEPKIDTLKAQSQAIPFLPDMTFTIPNNTTAIAVFNLSDPVEHRLAVEVQYIMSQLHGISYKDDLRYTQQPKGGAP